MRNQQIDRLSSLGAAVVGSLRFHADAGIEPGRDQRLAEVIDHPAVVEFAPLKSCELPDVVGCEDRVSLHHDSAYRRFRAGIERQAVVALVRLAIEQNIALADFNERITLLRQPHRDRCFRGLHVGRDNWITRLQRERLPRQFRRLGRSLGYCNTAECITAAGHRCQRDDKIALVF